MQAIEFFRGSHVALITPFNKTGAIDRKKLESLIEWQVSEGTDGILCAGTTGEGLSLNSSERKRICEICVKTAAKRIPVIVGTGNSDTKLTTYFTEQAQKSGADGCLVVTPFYNRPSQKGCVLHYREVAKVGLPIIIYHNPIRAGFKLAAETVAELAEIPGIVALKDSSHDLDLFRKIRTLSKIPILSGDDDVTYEIMREGGVGTISVIGNLIPKAWGQMVRLALEKNWVEAKKISDRYLPLCRVLFAETNPQCVKYAVSLIGKCELRYRLPIIEPEDSTKKELKSVWTSLSLPQFERVKSLLEG